MTNSETENAKRKILVIDDEPEVCELLADFLRMQGYQAMYASRSVEGLALAEKEKPDLVLLDIMMPEMDGLECLQRIRKSSPESIVIMVSGLKDEKVAKEAIRLGAYDYIGKPFDLSYLKDNLLARIFMS